MNVEMGHFLAAMATHVGEQSVPRRFQLKITRDLADRARKADNFLRAGSSAEVGKRAIGALWNDQDMDRRLRAYVMESQGPLVFIDLLARNLAAQDASKNVLVVVRRQSTDRHPVSP